MEAMFRISLDKDSYLANIMQANAEINQHYNAMREIAGRLKYLAEYTNCETVNTQQNGEAVFEYVLLNVDTDSLLEDIEKAEMEMKSHSRAIEEIISNLSIFRKLKNCVKIKAENAVPE